MSKWKEIIMNRKLTVSIIQPTLNPNMAESLRDFKAAVDRVMNGLFFIGHQNIPIGRVLQFEWSVYICKW